MIREIRGCKTILSRFGSSSKLSGRHVAGLFVFFSWTIDVRKNCPTVPLRAACSVGSIVAPSATQLCATGNGVFRRQFRSTATAAGTVAEDGASDCRLRSPHASGRDAG